MIDYYTLSRHGRALLPDADARLLLQHVSGLSHAQIIVRASDVVPPAIAAAYQSAIDRRLAGEPAAYIIGTAPFWRDEFAVSPAVLIPRPETEGILDAALTLSPLPAKILDIGTGSGCIALSLAREFPRAQVVACDIDESALSLARRNGETLGRENCEFLISDMGANLSGPFNLIVSNPPYIESTAISALMADVRKYEPYLALDGGQDGLDAYRQICANVPQLLTGKGHLILEIGFDQRKSVTALLRKAGMKHVRCAKDLAGHDRIIVARK